MNEVKTSVRPAFLYYSSMKLNVFRTDLSNLLLKCQLINIMINPTAIITDLLIESGE